MNLWMSPSQFQPIFLFTASMHNEALNEKAFFYLDLNCPPEITVNKREDKKHNKDNKYENRACFKSVHLSLNNDQA